MKLLMTCDAVGGVWPYATDLAHALADAGVEVVLAVMGPTTPLLFRGEERDGPQDRRRGEEAAARAASSSPSPSSDKEGSFRIIPTGLPLDWLAPGPEPVLDAGRAIAALAAEHAVDLIHLNSPALAAAGPFPAPVIAVAHGCVGTWWAAAHGTAPDAAYTWHGDLMRQGLLTADLAVAPSAAFAATLQRHYDLPHTPIAVHNGRERLPLPTVPQADHVLTAGRLWDRVKHTDLLDRTAALLPVPLRAAGPTRAPHGETVEPQHLQLLGLLGDAALAAEYAARPIFVSAARFEPFGLAVLEAAQAGCSLVLAGNDTFRELWTGAALFVGENTPEAYAAAIARVRTEPGLRAHLGEAARARAARYTPAACAAAMLALYRPLLTPARQAA